jgi:two-component system, LytTR family, sensor kinase
MKKRILVNWALPVGVWLAAALIGTTFSYDFRAHIGKPMAWMEIARVYVVAYFIWGAIFTPIVVWLCKRFVIEKRNWSSMIGLHVLFSIVIAGCNALLRAPLHRFVYPSEPPHPHSDLFRNYFLANAYDDMWMYWVVAAFAFGFMYYRKYKEREVQAVQLESQLTKARLEMLKMQLQPHFLFNTLHSVSALMRRDVDSAERVIAQLSDLLRISLESAEQQEITLKKELDFLEGYLDIEQTRFRDRLKVEYYIDSDCLDACVPNMLLQPIAENAVRHGIAPHSKPGVIEISARREGQTLRLSVRDNGKGIGPDGPKRKGVGLANTRERLEQHFPGRYKFELVDVPTGGLAVNVLIPFSTEQAAISEPSLVTKRAVDRPIAMQSAVGNIYDHTSLDRG